MAAPAGVDAPSSAVAAAPRAYLLDTSRAPGGSSIADMSESDQLAALDRLHRCFEAEGVEYWLLGGWAVDFHVGTVTPAHSDLDLAIWMPDLPRVATLPRREGWAHERPKASSTGSSAVGPSTSTSVPSRGRTATWTSPSGCPTFLGLRRCCAERPGRM